VVDIVRYWSVLKLYVWQASNSATMFSQVSNVSKIDKLIQLGESKICDVFTVGKRQQHILEFLFFRSHGSPVLNYSIMRKWKRLSAILPIIVGKILDQATHD